MKEFDRRIARLERTCAQQRLLLAATLVALFATAAAPRIPGPVEATEFILRDAHGRARARLAMDVAPWAVGGTVGSAVTVPGAPVPKSEPAPALILRAEDGSSEAVIAVTSDKQPTVLLRDGTSAAGLSVDPQGSPLLSLIRADGLARATLVHTDTRSEFVLEANGHELFRVQPKDR